MNGMHHKASFFHPGRLALSLLLALAILAASAPQATRAQANCRTFYVVQEDDTKPFIAHTFGLKWKEIAAANDMNPADKPDVGQQLCIPESDDEDNGPQVTPEGDSDVVFLVTISSGRVIVNVDDFNVAHVYKVKARDVDTGIGGWSNLGQISVAKNQAATHSFSLPDDLRGVPIITVCLKDQTTDELICRNAPNA